MLKTLCTSCFLTICCTLFWFEVPSCRDFYLPLDIVEPVGSCGAQNTRSTFENLSSNSSYHALVNNQIKLRNLTGVFTYTRYYFSFCRATPATRLAGQKDTCIYPWREARARDSVTRRDVCAGCFSFLIRAEHVTSLLTGWHVFTCPSVKIKEDFSTLASRLENISAVCACVFLFLVVG